MEIFARILILLLALFVSAILVWYFIKMGKDLGWWVPFAWVACAASIICGINWLLSKAGW